MIIQRIDPPELQPIAGVAHVTVAEGNRIVHVSGQTGVDDKGTLAGTTVGEQAIWALRNLRTALEAAGATLGDVAKLMIYIVDYTPADLDQLIEAALTEYGEDFPMTASTLVGVASLFQPDRVIEIDAVAVV